MRSRMTGKAKVVVAVLGLVLSASGSQDLRGEGDELFPGAKAYAFTKFREHIVAMRFGDVKNHWNCCVGRNMLPYRVDKDKQDKYASVIAGELRGCLPLKADADVSKKIKKSIIEEGECAKNIQKYLEFVTTPAFACVFFPLEMFRKAFWKCTLVEGTLDNGMGWRHWGWSGECRWSLQGELGCEVRRGKLLEDSICFDDLKEYTFYLVRYKEELSGCVLEMLYYFRADGMMAGFFPFKVMIEWVSRQAVTKRNPSGKDRRAVCPELSRFWYCEIPVTMAEFSFSE